MAFEEDFSDEELPTDDSKSKFDKVEKGGKKGDMRHILGYLN